MITTDGRSHIKRYMAQYVPAIAAAMAFGIGTRSEVGSDFGLQFEVVRAPITLITYDFVNDNIIYKASVPLDFAGIITEVGLYSQLSDSSNSGSKTLTDMNLSEVWVQSGTTTPSVFSTFGARAGLEGIGQTPGASTTRSDSLTNISLDLSQYSNADFITVAVCIGNSNTSALSVDLKTDGSNYYTLTLPDVTSGYKIVDFLKSAATVTGSPDWANINEIQVNSTSTSGGASLITWDGIRAQDTDTASLDYVLVARTVLSTAISKISNQTQDIEFPLSVGVS
jgi:hypothetical protein